MTQSSLITIHSTKGTECKTCYVINMSPGSFPSAYAVGDMDKVEEERRVLYVALTRAMDNLIVTRQSYSAWTLPAENKDEAAETYFFNDLPEGLFDEITHNRALQRATYSSPNNWEDSVLGINLD
ncbi:3'-5' exonuclease [Candidatus Nitrotoga arctica]|uniref:DNA 3'-5' helicase II n=1 Tax=Candidatus Nitrotoga arctica TaxID=453162 RepID=A0ABN8AKJ1_9PROT|nr:3'-5' exonuclease [Candidatus Nitrotoga arctica]CAG9932087.1 Plasmid conjugative transfer DNA helicase TrhI [Candidatus Nitrotoga arctica]